MASSPARTEGGLNARSTSYEFGGPLGAAAIIPTVPILVYSLYFGCSDQYGCPSPFTSIKELDISMLVNSNFWRSLWDTNAMLVYLAWYAFCVVSWAILPGDWVEGLPMRNGQRIKYKINAFPTFLLSLGITSSIILRYGPESFTFIYDKWIGFLTAAFLMSLVQAIGCYISSFFSDQLFALGGNTGNVIYDFYIGRLLNPMIGPLELKIFNELRPGIILWAHIDISMACKQYTLRGSLTNSMTLTLFFHLLYISDAVYNEPAILTVMDTTTDGFGYMLSVGDLLWVPFTYTMGARYLVFKHYVLDPIGTALVLLVAVTGYWIFRSANGEKNDFRNGRNPKNLKFMSTKRGTKLLISGWWGRSRHPNYFGDWLMAISWSLATGFNTPFTYFYPAWFFFLLVHRQRRDDEHCAVKYGEDWDKYKNLVRYRIIPYIY